MSIINKKLSVDWTDQWALFAESFKDGKAHIDLSPFGVKKTLLLAPGAGFGDLSHPTTYLMLQMMKGRMLNQTVIDIGSGSGILTLAAVLLGAKMGVGIDIDQAAILHAKKNAKLNHLASLTKFSKILEKTPLSGTLFLMNMISSEQKEVNPSRFNSYSSLWIVSGILETQKKEYLKQASNLGWILIEEHCRFGWMGFVFSV